MSKIKVLITEQISSKDIVLNAEIEYFDYDKKTRIKDLYKKIEKKKSLKLFHNNDFFINPSFEIGLRANYGYEKGKIDWNIDVSNLYVYKVKEYYEKDFIILWSHGGVGCAFNYSFYDKILDIIFKLMFNIALHFFMPRYKAVKLLETVTGKNIDYILDVINSKNEWKKGFISNKEFKYLLKVEKRIMKSEGYKLKNNIWLK